jgi:hypothetical protein
MSRPKLMKQTRMLQLSLSTAATKWARGACGAHLLASPPSVQAHRPGDFFPHFLPLARVRCSPQQSIAAAHRPVTSVPTIVVLEPAPPTHASLGRLVPSRGRTVTSPCCTCVAVAVPLSCCDAADKLLNAKLCTALIIAPKNAAAEQSVN